MRNVPAADQRQQRGADRAARCAGREGNADAMWRIARVLSVQSLQQEVQRACRIGADPHCAAEDQSKFERSLWWCRPFQGKESLEPFNRKREHRQCPSDARHVEARIVVVSSK